MASSINNFSKDLASAAGAPPSSSVGGPLSDLASSVERAVSQFVTHPPQANRENFAERISKLFDEPSTTFECKLAGDSDLTRNVSQAVARNLTSPGNFFDRQVAFGNSVEQEKSAGHKRKKPFSESETGKSSKKEEDSTPSSETRIKVDLKEFTEKAFDIWRNWRIGQKYEGNVSALDLISLCRGCEFITEESELFTWALTGLLFHPDLQAGDAQIILREFVSTDDEAGKLINTLPLPYSLRKNIIEKFAHAGHFPSQIEFLFPHLNNEFVWPQGMEKEQLTEWLKRAALEKDHTGSQMKLLSKMWNNPFKVDADDALAEYLLSQLKKKGEEGDETVIHFLINDSDLISKKERIYWLEKLSDKHPEDSWHKYELAKCYLNTPEIKDLEKAKEWLEKGRQILDGRFSNPTEACEILFSIGKAYEHDSSISSEMAKKEAFDCYQQAMGHAEHADGLTNLDIYYCKIADCYRKGIGVEINLKKALDFYNKAQERFDLYGRAYGSLHNEVKQGCEYVQDIYRGIAETYFAMSLAAFREGVSKTADYISSEQELKHLSSLAQMAQVSSAVANNFSKDIALARLKKAKEVFERETDPQRPRCSTLWDDDDSSCVSEFIKSRLKPLVKDLTAKGEYEKELQEIYQQVLQKIKGDLEKLQQAFPLDQISILKYKESLEHLKNLGVQGVDEILNPLQETTGKWESAEF